MEIGSILIGIVTGFLTGLATSFIFLFLISQLKPKIAISSVIVQGKGPQSYRIKVINRTRRIKFFRDGRVLNVKAKLELVTERHLHKSNKLQELEELDQNRLFSSRTIKLRKDEIFELGPLDKKDQNERYAYRFITDQDLIAMWTNPEGNRQFIRFTITATDSLSNFSAVLIQEYHNKTDAFRRGNFEIGNTFNVYPGEQIST